MYIKNENLRILKIFLVSMSVQEMTVQSNKY